MTNLNLHTNRKVRIRRAVDEVFSPCRLIKTEERTNS